MFPQIHYHLLMLPKSRAVDLDAQTSDILEATHKALNASNPTLAEDCWLCMAQGSSMPLEIPTNVSLTMLEKQDYLNCSAGPPFREKPVGFKDSLCLQGGFHNDTSNIDVGFIAFTNCSSIVNQTTSLYPAEGQVFICGGNMAYTFRPTNWTGICVTAVLLPDIEILPGDEPVPIPSLDYIMGQSKREVQFIPLLVGLGISGALGMGVAGVGVSVQLSNQIVSDVQALSSTIQVIQDQIDLLAEVILQNRRG